MKPCKFEFPCSPNDIVYLVTNNGVIKLIVTQIQIIKNADGKVEAVVCFPNYPFITLEEAKLFLFDTLDEALIYYNEYVKGKK